ncbi:ribosome small subunit-dependent GTPase A [Mycoplasma sp. 744]|uniref:ribosome small subunit-dependent GTPase A n=1 Tax=Mycoplasma sp. 744 TaxID=3108531 RepID=UPI002B1D1B0A|nr:ribosome small subunit-dependent GTPase A [Mycoplasma sp. 744]MEA4115237.1 ribosome small subunit-dependent GTPase A [Mycoplasma sp. 744]
MRGQIYSINAGKYTIKDENNNFHLLPAAGTFRYLGVIPLVGDYVDFVENKHIWNIYERKNSFIRPKVANIDHIIVVMSIKNPDFNSFLVDKYLALIENKNIEPILFFTKKDLGWTDEIDNYINLGYRVYLLNNFENNDLEMIKTIFKSNTCSFMGQSGVGKTTIINKILNLNLETQEISKKANRGKHTTRITKIYDIYEGKLIDTPGFSALDIKMTQEELSKSFKQFRELSKKCKFKWCLHYNEPENFCNIKLNINKLIPQFRYDNYVKLLMEIIKNEK